MQLELIANLDDPRVKRDLMTKIGAMRGTFAVTLKPHRPRRSNNANRYWFGVCVAAFIDYNAQQGEHYTPEQAHEILKRELLPPRQFVSPKTGEVIDVSAETHTMDREEFGRFIERGVVYLAEMGVIVPDPFTYAGIGTEAA